MGLDSIRRFLRSPAGQALKIALSLGLLTWFALRIDRQRLTALGTAVRVEYLALIAILSVLRIVISAMRFRQLVAGVVAIPLGTLCRQYFVASTFNHVLPTALGGDVVRVFMLSDEGLPKQEGAALIVVERLAGVVALVVLAVYGVSAYPVDARLRLVVLVLAVVAAVGTAVFFGLGRRLRSHAERGAALSRAAAAAAGLTERPSVAAITLLLSLALQITSIAVSWVVALAVGVELSFVACLALVPLVWIVTLLPISIGGIGLREASFVVLLGTVGLSTEESLVVSLGTFASLVLNGAIGGALLLLGTVRVPTADQLESADEGPSAE